MSAPFGHASRKDFLLGKRSLRFMLFFGRASAGIASIFILYPSTATFHHIAYKKNRKKIFPGFFDVPTTKRDFIFIFNSLYF